MARKWFTGRAVVRPPSTASGPRWSWLPATESAGRPVALGGRRHLERQHVVAIAFHACHASQEVLAFGGTVDDPPGFARRLYLDPKGQHVSHANGFLAHRSVISLGLSLTGCLRFA